MKALFDNELENDKFQPFKAANVENNYFAFKQSNLIKKMDFVTQND